MPRAPRTFADGVFCHVSDSAARGALLDTDGAEASRFAKATRKVSPRNRLATPAWC